MLSNSHHRLYVTQPFFTLENYSSNLYYWADYIEIDTTSIEGFYEFDGVGDNSDAFPNDSNETVDSETIHTCIC